MSLQVFLGNCAEFVLSTAKLIGLVTPQFHQQHHRIINSSSSREVVNAFNTSRPRRHHIPIHPATTTTTAGSHSNSHHPHPESTPNNRQLLCDGVSWRCNHTARWCFHAKTLLCLILYPLAVLFVKTYSGSSSATSSYSYFSLFVFITLYFHYALMVVALAGSVMGMQGEFTEALLELYALIQEMCNSTLWNSSTQQPGDGGNESGGTTPAGRHDDDDDLTSIRQRRVWMRARLIDLGLKCGLLGLIFVVLSWLNIILPVLTADNWITVLFPSLILILPVAVLLLLSSIFYATSLIMECLLLILNEWLRVHCMARMNPLAKRRGNKLWQLSICDNVDIITQYYSRTLQLLKQFNRFHAVPILLIVLNCFFNVAVQSFSIYMTFSDEEDVATVATTTTTTPTSDSIRQLNDSSSGYRDWSPGAAVYSGITVEGDPGELPQTVPYLYIMAVNSVYILINYCELWATIRASTRHRTLVSRACAFSGSGIPRGANCCGQIIFQSYLGHSFGQQWWFPLPEPFDCWPRSGQVSMFILLLDCGLLGPLFLSLYVWREWWARKVLIKFYSLQCQSPPSLRRLRTFLCSRLVFL